MDQLISALDRGLTGCNTAPNAGAQLQAAIASLRELQGLTSALPSSPPANGVALSMLAWGVGSIAALGAEAARVISHRGFVQSMALLTISSARVLYSPNGDATTAVAAAIEQACAPAKSSAPAEHVAKELRALVQQLSESKPLAGSIHSLAAAVTAWMRALLDVGDAAPVAVILEAADALAACPRARNLDSPIVTSVSSSDGTKPAGNDVRSTVPEEAKHLVLERDTAEQRRTAALAAAKDEQSAALERRLAAKRAKLAQRQPSPASPAGNATDNEAIEVPATARWLLQRETREVVDDQRSVVASTAAIRRGIFEPAGVEVPTVLGDVHTCAVHAAQRKGVTESFAFHSLSAIAAKLPEVLRAGKPQELFELVSMMLSLADVLMDSLRDLSHAEHLIACTHQLLDSSRQESQPERQTCEADLKFVEASFAFHFLKLLAAVPEGVEHAALFRNPAYPPDELNGASHDERSDTAAWGGRETRVAVPLAGVPPPRLMVALTQGRLHVAEKAFVTLQSLTGACEEVFTIDTDCERFVRHRRMLADGSGTMFELTGQTAFAETRLEVLDRLRRCGLDSLVFRNVLRQAEFDSASTHMALAETEAGDAQAHWQAAADLLDMFTAAFRKELDAARKNRVETAFEANEAAGYLAAESRKAQCLIRLKNPKAAKASLRAALALREVTAITRDDVQAQLGLLKQLEAALHP